MPKRDGFTLIELLVVIAIISLLVSILLPSLKRTKELAKRVVCAMNVHTLLAGVHVYFSDNDELPDHSHYDFREWNYFALNIGEISPVEDAMEMTTGDFTAMYPNYVGVPDAYYCPDGPHSPRGKFCFWAPWHGIMGRYLSYQYSGRSVPDGLWRNPGQDIHGKPNEIPESLYDASPEATLLMDWSWWEWGPYTYAAHNHPSYDANIHAYDSPGRDGINSGRVDGSVLWVDDSDTWPRHYIQNVWWHAY